MQILSKSNDCKVHNDNTAAVICLRALKQLNHVMSAKRIVRSSSWILIHSDIRCPCVNLMENMIPSRAN